MKQYLRELYDSRLTLYALTSREIRGKYRRTFLGQLWSLANPLTQMLVYTFVFSFVFQVKSMKGDPSGLDSFALYLLCGLIPWTLFQSSVMGAIASPLANVNLITKVYFPRMIIPLASLVSRLYNSGFEFLVLGVALALAGSMFWPLLPVAIVIIFLLASFAAGLGLLLSILNLQFRDTEYLLGIFFQVWMWLSPIIYPISLVASRSATLGPIPGTNITLLDVYSVNPIVHFVTAFRNVMYDNRMPSAIDVGLCAVWALVSLVVGFLTFRRMDGRLAEFL
jgi:ABC-2 type transport system permease protein